MKRSVLLLALWFIAHTAWGITPAELGDSLTAYTRERINILSAVKVTRLTQKDMNIRVETNALLSGLSLSLEELDTLRTMISRWVRGDEEGLVSIYSDEHELGELITARFRPRDPSQRYVVHPHPTPDLQGNHIALWPSHGAFHNLTEDAWHWQRARMWGIVEDLFSTRYSELVSRMIEQAGGRVYWPRPRVGVDSAALNIGESGLPRWMEGARYWLQYREWDPKIWYTASGKNDYNDDLRCRGNWVNTLNDSLGLDLVLALHTDGISLPGDSSLVGPMVIYTDYNDQRKTLFCTGTCRLQNRDLGDYVLTQMVEDMNATSIPWPRRELRQANYCETRYPNIPSIIVEILSHKNMADMRIGLDPNYQFVLSRAIYKGVLRYLHSMDETPYIVQPLPPCHMKVDTRNDHSHTPHLVLTWDERTDELESTATPTFYRVYTSKDNSEWTDTIVRANKYTLHYQPGVHYRFYVVAANEGGCSFPGETIAAYIAPQEKKRVLLVNGFDEVRGPDWFSDSTYAGIVPGSFAIPYLSDRTYLGEQQDFVRSHPYVSDDEAGFGHCYSNYLGMNIVGNTFDYTTHRANLLPDTVSYISCAIDALDGIDKNIDMVEIILGKQRHIDTQRLNGLDNYVRHGGRLLISGAYLPAGKWVRTHHACTSGRIMIPSLGIITYSTLPNEQRLQAEDVMALQAYKGGKLIARYQDTNLGACQHWTTDKGGQCLLWGVPLDSMEDLPSVYKYCLQILLQ